MFNKWGPHRQKVQISNNASTFYNEQFGDHSGSDGKDIFPSWPSNSHRNLSHCTKAKTMTGNHLSSPITVNRLQLLGSLGNSFCTILIIAQECRGTLVAIALVYLAAYQNVYHQPSIFCSVNVGGNHTQTLCILSPSTRLQTLRTKIFLVIIFQA